jgi:hypothetical protein
MFFGLFYDAGNNKTHPRFYINCPKFLSDFNQVWIFRQFFIKLSNVEFRGCPSIGGRTKYMSTDGQTGRLTKVIGALREDANAPKNGQFVKGRPFLK